jgi:hypothetical protein
MVTSSSPKGATSSERRRWLIAAFKDEPLARRAASDAETAGVDLRDIRIGNSLDALASIQAEMREEMSHSGTGPTGPLPKEGARGLVIGTVLGAIVGIGFALPFAAIGFGGLEISTRLLILGAVGLVFGSFLGWFLGGMFGPKRPSEPLAAAKGAMLALPDTDVARRALLRTQPTRIDVFGAGGFLIGTLATDDPGARGTLGQIADHARDEARPD